MIDNKTIEQARNTDIIRFFEQRYGFTFAFRSGSYRCRQHPSLAINDNRLSWYWHSKSIGGFGVLDYLMKAENMPFCEAIETVATISPTAVNPRQQEAKKQKVLALPEKAEVRLRLHNYLCRKRGIDSDIVNMLIKDEKLYEDRRGNIVFVGYDEHNKARFASLRGTSDNCSFRMDCAGSDKKYSFNMAYMPSKRLYIFESAIDSMSHASLENLISADKSAWLKDNRLSLAGTSDAALPFFLNKHTTVRELAFCLDNDPIGHEAAAVMAKRYANKGYYTSVEMPKNKDFNNDLLEYRVKEGFLT